MLIVAGLGATVQRNRAYTSAISIWSDTVAKLPENFRAHNNLAAVLATLSGREAEAIAHFEAALRGLPDSAVVHLNLARELEKLAGRRLDAARHYEAALKLNPALAEAAAALRRLRQN